MTETARFLSQHAPVVAARLTRVRGSSPREEGATILVSASEICGTIGGGQLEYMVIDQARALLSGRKRTHRMDVPLGPEIGQCCGGRVEISLQILEPADKEQLLIRAENRRAAQPHVMVFGAGHVGRALTRVLSLLPVQPTLIDSRAEEMALAPAGCRVRLTAMPEAEVRQAPPGSAYVIVTHDHSLDFLIAAEALQRRDAAYVGMIGSATKRAGFARWAREQADVDCGQLICPMAADRRGDKRPEVIAAFVAAEIMAALAEVQTPVTSGGALARLE